MAGSPDRGRSRSIAGGGPAQQAFHSDSKSGIGERVSVEDCRSECGGRPARSRTTVWKHPLSVGATRRSIRFQPRRTVCDISRAPSWSPPCPPVATTRRPPNRARSRPSRWRCDTKSSGCRLWVEPRAGAWPSTSRAGWRAGRSEPTAPGEAFCGRANRPRCSARSAGPAAPCRGRGSTTRAWSSASPTPTWWIRWTKTGPASSPAFCPTTPTCSAADSSGRTT